MNAAKRARLRRIPEQLKSLAAEAVGLLEKDGYLANQSQWRGELLDAVAHLERVISEQVEGGGQLVSPGRETRSSAD